MGASPAAGAAVSAGLRRAVAAAADAGSCYQSAKHEVPAERKHNLRSTVGGARRCERVNG